MKLYVVRHAKAGSRSRWDGPDEKRPLSKSGRKQASGLVELLRDAPISRIVSSPHVRCVQTVEPLADTRGLRVEPSDSLAEGAPLREALRVVDKVADEPAVLCTHGDVISDLLSYLDAQRVPLEGAERGFAKGSVWLLDLEQGGIVSGRYLQPPPID